MVRDEALSSLDNDRGLEVRFLFFLSIMEALGFVRLILDKFKE